MAAVTSLLIEPWGGGSPRSVERVEAVQGEGLRGDRHARPLGPRQVLLVRQESLEELDADAVAVQANLVIAGLDAASPASGDILAFAGGARVRLTHECEVCAVLRSRLPDQRSFRLAAGRRGVHGVVLDSGTIACGSAVELERGGFEAVPAAIGDRALWVVARIPEGRVLTYRTLVELIGGRPAHFRAVPAYLRRADAAGLPAHRVLTSDYRLTGYITDQQARLAAEGIAADRTIDRAQEWDARLPVHHPRALPSRSLTPP